MTVFLAFPKFGLISPVFDDPVSPAARGAKDLPVTPRQKVRFAGRTTLESTVKLCLSFNLPADDLQGVNSLKDRI